MNGLGAGYKGSLARRRPQKLVVVPSGPRIMTVDELLRTCPTAGEIRRIRNDFNIIFDVDPPSWSCTYSGDESSEMLTVHNLFRLARLINFDRPMPLIGATNLYSWLRSLNLTYHFEHRERSSAGGYGMWIRSENLAQPWNRSWLDPRQGIGISNFIALILHEARHTTPGGDKPHDCALRRDTPNADGTGPHDSTIRYGGAWALQYWYYVWLGRHSGPYLSYRQKHSATSYAHQIWLRSFCDAEGR